MKKFLHSHHRASKGAALIIVLAFVVLATALAVVHFSRSTTDRQLAQSSYNDTSADLLARSALDIVVGDFKQEIINAGSVNQSNIQPQRSGGDPSIPNLIRRSVRNDPVPAPPGVSSLASSVGSTDPSAGGRSISLARWNSHYLVPLLNPSGTDSTPVSSFVAPDWVLVTAQGPNPAAAPGDVIGRYAFAVYDEGGLIDINLGGFPTYASLTLPTRPTRRMARKYPLEESEIMFAVCQAPDITPGNTNETGGTGQPYSWTARANHSPTTFYASFLPHGLTLDPSTGTISGVPTSPGSFTITLTASNACGTGSPGTLHLTINGRIGPDSTPWPVNLARKGTVAFADLKTLPSTPTLTDAQIDQLMGWRNYATMQQTGASFNSPPPSYPLAQADYYAQYFLGAFPPPDYVFTTPFTTVSTTVSPNGRTDQAMMTRQELVKLQRTIGFDRSLLQYLGTFSRERNRPAPDWSQTLAARWDMNNLQGMIPDSWIRPGHHGVGHAFGKQRHALIGQLFGLVWVDGTHAGHGTPASTRFTEPNYYGHWQYFHDLSRWSANPDFFQIIDYAMNQANGGTPDPNHVRNTFTVGAALIDQYDTDDLYDPDPDDDNFGNTITIIDYDGNPLNYAYGIEGMSYDDPAQNSSRPPFAPGWGSPPLPANYVLLNRRFENVGEFGYAYNPASTLPSKTLDFASSALNNHDKPLLDFFTYNRQEPDPNTNKPPPRAGIVNLNTRNAPVLASIIRGAWLRDQGSENPPPDATYLASQAEALTAAQGIVQETTSGGGPALTRADAARLAEAATNKLVADLLWSPPVPDEKKQTIARALAEVGQARTWNLMIDVIAQTGNYAPGTPDLTDPSKFIVQGEKRYWLHIALDRDSGAVLGSQLEEVTE